MSLTSDGDYRNPPAAFENLADLADWEFARGLVAATTTRFAILSHLRPIPNAISTFPIFPMDFLSLFLIIVCDVYAVAHEFPKPPVVRKLF